MSALFQMGEHDELIIVDDASPDDTLAVAKSLAQSDPRVQIIPLPQNGGGLHARCVGATASSGSHVLFLDGDDEYLPGLMDTLRATLCERPWDIVHFGIEVRTLKDDGYYVDEQRKPWFLPYDGTLTGKEVFAACFVRHDYQWNLVNKCFDGDLIRLASSFVPEGWVQRGDDAVLYFMASYFASSYKGLADTDLYAYYYGAGQDSARLLDIDEFTGLCQSQDASRAVAEFLDGQQAEDEIYQQGLGEMSKLLCDGIARKIQSQVKPSDVYEAIRAFADAWGEPAAVAALVDVFEHDLDWLSDALSYPASRRLRPGDTIASFYRCFTGGGAENVQRMLVKVWQSLGLKVVLLLEQEPDEEEIAKLGVEWRLLPEASCPREYRPRLEALGQAVRDFDIKGIVYHQWLYWNLFWDQTFFKIQGIPFYVHCHGIFVHLMECNDFWFSWAPYAYQNADGIVSLSEVDALWWQLFNPRTFVTVNPSLYKSDDVGTGDGQREHRILWLGRVSPEKRPFDALEVFAKLLKQVPDAHLDFVGGAVDPAYEQRVHDRAKELGIEDAVTFTGWSNQQDRYYRQARVFLMTSDPKEGYPLTLGECQAFGIPCVMYDLPYLTLVRSSKGICVVRPEDQDAAASELADLMTNDTRYESMREGALEMARSVESFDFRALWTEVLLTDHVPEKDFLTRENARIAAHMLLVANKMGHAMQDEKVAQLEGLSRDAHQQLADVTNSYSFGIGRAMTAAPRGVRDGLRQLRSAWASHSPLR